ncbi:MAG: AI-2E family transporter [Lachnospiraceae bacterium]|jgi:predicted PurR-regulated permease PerM|nr:AI-2E family transporter [Lachnospiraceae bacterium]
MSSNKQRLAWLRNLPPLFTLALVTAFGILFYKIVRDIDISGIHFSRILTILNPFITGLVITFFLVPLVKLFENRLYRLKKIKLPAKVVKLLATLISYVLIFGLLILILVYIIPQMFAGLSTLITLLIDSIQYLYGNLNSFIDYWDQSSWSSLISGQDVYRFLGDQLSSLAINLQNIASTVLPMLYKTIAGIASGSINFIVGIIISIYLVNDRHRVAFAGKRLLYALLRQSWADRVLNLAQETLLIFRRFFIGKALDSLIIGILCFVFMKLFRLPYAELISVIVGITNIIPYFGPFIGAIPSILIILMVSPMDALIFSVFILALQQLDGNIIGPAILGNSLGLKPIWIIFSVTVGGGLFGIAGMLIGVPAFTVLYTLFQRMIQNRLKRKGIASSEQIEEIDRQRLRAQKNKEETTP